MPSSSSLPLTTVQEKELGLYMQHRGSHSAQATVPTQHKSLVLRQASAY